MDLMMYTDSSKIEKNLGSTFVAYMNGVKALGQAQNTYRILPSFSKRNVGSQQSCHLVP